MLLDDKDIPDGISGKSWFRILGIVSVLIAVPVAILSLPPVQDQIFERTPKLGIELTSEIPVLDVRRPMEGLAISLNGTNLNTSVDSLVATRVVIKNNGKTGIKANDVSAADPIGFSITGGSIVEITGFKASTSHLRRLARPVRSGNTVTIKPNVIIDPNDTLSFDILVKKPRASEISISALGKIADLRSIKVSDFRETSNKEGFWERSFLGSPAIQLTRILAYFFLGLAIIAGFIFIMTTITSRFDKTRERKRKFISEKFISESSQRNDVANAFAASLYYVFGIDGISMVLREAKKVPASDQIGPIENRKFKDLIGRDEYDADFEGFNKFLDSVLTTPSSIRRVERDLNFVSRGRKDIQPAYLEALEAMALLASAVDEKGKLKSNRDMFNRYFTRQLSTQADENEAGDAL